MFFVVFHLLSARRWPIFLWRSLIWIYHIFGSLVVFLSCLLVDVPSGSMSAFPSCIFFLGSKMVALFWFVYILVVKIKLLLLVLAIFSSKIITVKNLKNKVLSYGFAWKPLCSSRVMLNRFYCRLGITTISVNMILCSFPSQFCYTCKSPRLSLINDPLSPMVTLVSAYSRFVIFSSLVTICDVAPESAIFFCCRIYFFSLSQ